jgi:hypothetical protein
LLPVSPETEEQPVAELSPVFGVADAEAAPTPVPAVNAPAPSAALPAESAPEVQSGPSLPDEPLLSGTTPRPKGRGRHQSDFWPEVENHIFDLLDKHGPPSPDDPELPNQKALEDLVATFMQRKGWEAAESTIREHVVGMLNYRGTQGR